MPNASVTIAAVVKALARQRPRHAERMSWFRASSTIGTYSASRASMRIDAPADVICLAVYSSLPTSNMSHEGNAQVQQVVAAAKVKLPARPRRMDAHAIEAGRPQSRPDAGLYGRRGNDARDWDRRQHSRIRRHPRRPLEAAALSAVRTSWSRSTTPHPASISRARAPRRSCTSPTVRKAGCSRTLGCGTPAL